MPLPDLALRWAALASLGSNELEADTTGIHVSSNGAATTVQQLEQLPIAKEDLADSQQEEKNDRAEIGQANTVIGQQKNQIDGLNLQISDGQRACKAEVTAVKAEARKSKLRWFGVGFVSGFVAGHIW